MASTINNKTEYLESDFEALERHVTEVQSREALPGYWVQVWRQLLSDPKGKISIVIILFLFLFSSIGPIVWPYDAAEQDLDLISLPPSFETNALLLLEEDKRWKQEARDFQNENLSKSFGEIKFLGRPHTLSVNLTWLEHPDAKAYKIYRHEYPPSGIRDLGLPLAKVEPTGEKMDLVYQDRLSLEAIRYYYSVAVLDEKNKILDYASAEVKPRLALKTSQAELKKYGLSHKNNMAMGQGNNLVEDIKLPAHPMGTDYLGRDLMARLMLGGQTSLYIAIFASLLFVILGSLYGAMSAYIGGQFDNVLMRFADFVIALPFLLFMILFKVAFSIGPGESGIAVMIFSLIMLSWPASARLIRGQVLSLKEQNYILAARINGASTLYVIFRHLLPNVLSLILVSLSFAIPSVILTEAFLSFIGLGVVPPTPSWGSMCQEGIKNFLFHPHELIFPAGFIALTVLSFNLFGDSLRDALDVNAT